MNKAFFYILLFTASLYFMSSCSSGRKGKSHGAIVLGDPSTIVTETDAQYLKDNITDYQPHKSSANTDAAGVVDSTPKQAAPAETVQPEREAASAPGDDKKGLSVAFKGVTVFIPGISVRSFRQQDPASVNGVSYSLEEGKLAGNVLQVKGAVINKVMQRYQAVVILDDREAGNMLLQSLGKYTSGWTTLKGKGNEYAITGIDKNQLQFSNVSPAAIRNAITKAARSNRLSKKEETILLKRVKNIRSVKQLPLSIWLQSVIWKISGKDASGKSIEKELRIDLPMK